MLNILLPLIFIIGIVFIALEEQIKINKAAIALSMSIIMWCLVFAHIDLLVGVVPENTINAYVKNHSLEGLGIVQQTKSYVTNILLIDELGKVATTVLFVMATLVIIKLVDCNGGFRGITESIGTRKKRKLLWIIALLSFFISAVLDNIAAAIVVIALLRKLVETNKDRTIFACITIISANAGGAWSPIGDVTTIILWSNGNLTALHQIFSLIIPSIVTLVLPLLMAQRFFGKNEMLPKLPKTKYVISKKRKIYGIIILIMGVLSLAAVPVFSELTSLPPFMGVLFGLSILWIFTDSVYGRLSVSEENRISVVKIFSQIDMATIMFFFGILMSVSAIDATGILKTAGGAIGGAISNPLWISFGVGICSSFIDNVALIAATIGMYPIAEPGAIGAAANFVQNSEFWTFLAYCGVTGGSILIIGSATGITVMGIEKISFIYYLKNFSLLAFIGYLGGALCFLLINSLF